MNYSLRLLLIVALASLLHFRSGIAPAAERPNVLFLICDDLNCDLGCYGHRLVQTPNIDALAARGVRFSNAHCQFPLCGPSRASFMTGLYPDQNLVKRNAIYIREHVPNVLTMSQLFRGADYFATRIGKIYHYNVPKHVGTGGHDDPYSWNRTINPRGRDKDEEDKIFSLVPGSFGATLSWLAAEGADHEQTDGIAAGEAAQVLKQHAARGDSFYLAVGLYRPHTPYVAPRSYFDLYRRDEIQVPTIPAGYLDTLPSPARQSLTRRKNQNHLDPDVARQAIEAYYASISFADAQLGIILDTLTESGLAENTIVLFTSDHGYHMGEHDYYQKTTLFENATRVPLIMAGPGIQQGAVAETLAEMVDFYPTLAELAGLEPPPHVAGLSLVPALREAKAIVRESALTQYANGYSLRTARYRYTEWGESAAAGRELYDHNSDPEEMINLAGKPGTDELIDQLSAVLRTRIAAAQQSPQGVKQNRFENTRRVPQPN